MSLEILRPTPAETDYSCCNNNICARVAADSSGYGGGNGSPAKKKKAGKLLVTAPGVYGRIYAPGIDIASECPMDANTVQGTLDNETGTNVYYFAGIPQVNPDNSPGGLNYLAVWYVDTTPDQVRAVSSFYAVSSKCTECGAGSGSGQQMSQIVYTTVSPRFVKRSHQDHGARVSIPHNVVTMAWNLSTTKQLANHPPGFPKGNKYYGNVLLTLRKIDIDPTRAGSCIWANQPIPVGGALPTEPYITLTCESPLPKNWVLKLGTTPLYTFTRPASEWNMLTANTLWNVAPQVANVPDGLIISPA